MSFNLYVLSRELHDCCNCCCFLLFTRERLELRWRCGLRSDGRKVEGSIPGSDIELLEAVLILQMNSEAWKEQSESHPPSRPRKIVLMYGDKTEKRVTPLVGIEPMTSCPSDRSPQSPP